jgi:aryl-alcohol dehydrogenase-like predicted oxidoreductase
MECEFKKLRDHSYTSLNVIKARKLGMTSFDKIDTFTLGARSVNRLGYGAMQLAGPGVFGPPKDREGALAVLREAVASGINHIDTSDFYGPHVTNQIIREALHPYPDDLTIVTKIGARRGEDASWLPAFSAKPLTQAVHDNLRNLGLGVLDVVNHADHVQRAWSSRGLDRGAAHRFGRIAAAGAGAAHRPEQCYARAGGRGA